MKTLMKIIRRRKVGKKGVVVAFPIDGEIRYGWSLCRNEDSWSREVGISLAESRAVDTTTLAELSLSGKIPHTCRRPLVDLIERSRRYYHTI